jgi:hypothetical protein
VHIGGGQGLAADPSVAAFHLLDQAKGDLAYILALDRHHCVSQLANDFALLFLAEHVLNYSNLNEWHQTSPFVWLQVGPIGIDQA